MSKYHKNQANAALGRITIPHHFRVSKTGSGECKPKKTFQIYGERSAKRTKVQSSSADGNRFIDDLESYYSDLLDQKEREMAAEIAAQVMLTRAHETSEDQVMHDVSSPNVSISALDTRQEPVQETDAPISALNIHRQPVQESVATYRGSRSDFEQENILHRPDRSRTTLVSNKRRRDALHEITEQSTHGRDGVNMDIRRRQSIHNHSYIFNANTTSVDDSTDMLPDSTPSEGHPLDHQGNASTRSLQGLTTSHSRLGDRDINIIRAPQHNTTAEAVEGATNTTEPHPARNLPTLAVRGILVQSREQNRNRVIKTARFARRRSNNPQTTRMQRTLEEFAHNYRFAEMNDIVETIENEVVQPESTFGVFEGLSTPAVIDVTVERHTGVQFHDTEQEASYLGDLVMMDIDANADDEMSMETNAPTSNLDEHGPNNTLEIPQTPNNTLDQAVTPPSTISPLILAALDDHIHDIKARMVVHKEASIKRKQGFDFDLDAERATYTKKLAEKQDLRKARVDYRQARHGQRAVGNQSRFTRNGSNNFLSRLKAPPTIRRPKQATKKPSTLHKAPPNAIVDLTVNISAPQMVDLVEQNNDDDLVFMGSNAIAPMITIDSSSEESIPSSPVHDVKFEAVPTSVNLQDDMDEQPDTIVANTTDKGNYDNGLPKCGLVTYGQLTISQTSRTGIANYMWVSPYPTDFTEPPAGGYFNIIRSDVNDDAGFDEPHVGLDASNYCIN